MKPHIAITAGDISGIGPEIVIKSILTREVRAACVPVIVGPLDRLHGEARRLRLTGALTRHRNEFYWQDVWMRREPKLKAGTFSKDSGLLAGWSIMHAAAMAMAGDVAAIVTAPVSKQGMYLAGFKFPGQTELLQALTGSTQVAMMLVGADLRVGLATTHIALRAVSEGLSTNGLCRRVETIHSALRVDWAIKRPRIALLGMNPHAGEGGALGDEEKKVIEPALRRLRKRGLQVSGPFPADGFFARYDPKRWDAVVAMYHDQGLIPLKMRAEGRGVNVSAGLPIVRTSPDHGTAYDIAGKNLADPTSMIEAILLAVRLASNRSKFRGRTI